MIALAVISFLILGSGMAVSISRYGLRDCWSSYGEPWESDSPMNLNIWSAVNVLAASCLVPPMLHIGQHSLFQSFGFFAPLFLFLVGLTPDYKTSKTKNLIHQIGAWGSVVMTVVWLFMAAREWFAIFPAAVLASVLAIGTRSARQSWMLWLEVWMFLAVYLTLFIML